MTPAVHKTAVTYSVCGRRMTAFLSTSTVASDWAATGVKGFVVQLYYTTTVSAVLYLTAMYTSKYRVFQKDLNDSSRERTFIVQIFLKDPV